jgi:hypothetical protein
VVLAAVIANASLTHADAWNLVPFVIVKVPLRATRGPSTIALGVEAGGTQ